MTAAALMGQRKTSKNIQAGSLQYALRSIRLCQRLRKQKDSGGWAIEKQYVRAASLIGANIEEAQAAESHNDFVRKPEAARKETEGSLYWLALLEKSELASARRIAHLIKERRGLFNIITAIILQTGQNAWSGGAFVTRHS